MHKKIQLLLSGIPLVDREWHGLYRGGTYLLIGSYNSGKTLLCLQYAKEAAKQDEICLFITNSKPQDLIIQAASVNIDLQTFMEKNQIIIIKVGQPSNSEIPNKNGDILLIEYLKDIVMVVKQFKPVRIVFDDLTSFIEFSDIDRLQNVFLQNWEIIEDAGITTLCALSETATSGTQEIVDSISAKCTVLIYLKKMEKEPFGEMI